MISKSLIFYGLEYKVFQTKNCQYSVQYSLFSLVFYLRGVGALTKIIPYRMDF